MAKKKKSSSNDKSGFQYSVELTGLLLVLIGLIGFGFGPAGELIKKFALFLIGEWWPVILLLVLYLGIHMIVKRKLPKFFSIKLTGFYILVLVVLVLSHYSFIENSPAGEIFSATIDQFMDRVDSIGTVGNVLTSGNREISIGGGIIGAGASFALASLFGSTGTIIVLAILAIFGFIMLFDIDLGSVLSDLFSKFKFKNKEKRVRKVSNDYEDEVIDEVEEVDNRVIITSVDDLKTHTEIKDVEEELMIPEQQNLPIVNENKVYRLPSMSILDDVPKKKSLNNEFVKNHRLVLERVLGDFQIKANVVEIHVGPSVTQYEVAIPNGTKVSKIVGINKEIALALAAKDVRIQAPIPGKSTIGIEIPNPVISPVKFKEIVDNVPSSQAKANIIASLGKDIMGRVQTADISKMPHLLVAGSTGSGKSVCINSFIATILMKYRPDEVKLVMVDPKKVELSNYNGVPHLLCPVVTNPKKASVALQKMVTEMERRYEEFSEKEVKNIASYNEYIDKENAKTGMCLKKMPYIVIIIDELADLMLVAAKEVEDSIMRITQMARAAGIHLIVATQRPSTDVITGVVKANIPSRISFAVASQIDSRTILDSPGAEKLLGKGDMLYLPMGENVPIRIQGCFITDDEIRRVIEYVCKEQIAQYDNSITEEPASDHNPVSGDPENYEDPLYNEIVEFAVQTGKLSASLLQRRFRLGYNRAARVIDLLEDRGIIGPANGSKPREVLVKLESDNTQE